ncbi:helix-turn-helix domain-containing protein [Paraburkholderia pallida]|nr:AraC family transcriptional regulator [Paraburkholderia pallida]
MNLVTHHKLPLLRSYEPAETGQHLARFLASTKVTPLGDLERPAQVSGIHIGAFSIAVVALGTAVSLEAVGDGDYAVMIACLEGSGEVEENGQVYPMLANRGYLACPRGVLRARFSRDSVRLVIRMETGLLGALPLQRNMAFGVTNPALAPWFDYVQFLLSSRASIDAIGKDYGVRERVEALMVTLLERTALPAILDDQRQPSVSREVRRAEAFIRENLTKILSLEEIADAAGVSVRTLQASFKRHHDVSPMRYMRDLRLDVAREQILAGSSITDAAFDCGIPHAGRFAQYYRSRFGHLPSSTGPGSESES